MRKPRPAEINLLKRFSKDLEMLDGTILPGRLYLTNHPKGTDRRTLINLLRLKIAEHIPHIDVDRCPLQITKKGKEILAKEKPSTETAQKERNMICNYTDEELAEMRAETIEFRVQRYGTHKRQPPLTCDDCNDKYKCALVYDPYNTNGECLAMK